MHLDKISDTGNAKRSRTANILDAAVEYFVQILVTGAFLAALLTKNGVPDSLVGILSSFVSLTCVFQIFSEYTLKHISGIKKAIIFLVSANELIFLFLYVIPIFSVSSTVKCVIFVVSLFAAYALYNLEQPFKFAWYMYYVSSEERGRFTAKKEIISLVGGVAFSFIMGFVSDKLNYAGKENTAFLVSALTMFFLCALHFAIIFFTPENSMEVSHYGKGVFTSFRVLKIPSMSAIIVLEILWKSSQMITTSFYGTYQISELAFTLTFVSFLTMVESVVRIVFSPLMGKITDRFGLRTSLCACFTAAVLCTVSMIFCTPSTGKFTYILYSVFHGIAMSGVNSGLKNISLYCVPQNELTAALGVKDAIGGVCGFLAATVASIFLSKIQTHGGIFIFGIRMYAQQLFSLVGALLIAIALIWTAVMLKGLKNNKV